MDGIAQVLESFDRDITLYINSFHTPFSDAVWTFVSDTKVWIPLYLAVLVLIWYRLGWKKMLIALLAIAVTVLWVDQMGNLVKTATGRLRPCHDYNMLMAGLHTPVSRGGMYSFYSAHAANAFGFLSASFILLREDRQHRYYGYAMIIFVWAFVVSLSRIFLAKHFLGDVCIGMLVGLLCGAVAGNVGRFLMTCLIRPEANSAETSMV